MQFLTIKVNVFWCCACVCVCVYVDLLPGSFKTDLYVPLQQRCNFTDRVNFHRQLVRDREHQKASPPHRRTVLLFYLLSTS